MADELAEALDTLRAAANRLAAANAEAAEAVRARDDALRAAQQAGATYVLLQEVAGITAPTVVKALRRQ